jgi:1-acyl-sn-glycerol-3-phosphate acyltransferase
MCSHASNLDPLVVMASSPVTVKFIFKQSLLVLFYIFGLAYFYGNALSVLILMFIGHIPINRSKREKAIQSLIKAGKKIAKYNRAIGIFPEGTRSHTGALQEFKKGPFHLVVDAGIHT